MPLLLIVLAAFGGHVGRQNELTTQQYSLVVWAEKPSVKAGSDVWIKVQFTNFSDNEADASGNFSNQTGLDPYYKFDVMDEGGAPVAKRKYDVPAEGSPVNRTIKAGETLTEEQNIGRLFDLSRPGKYSVRVLRHAPDAASPEVVKSNTIVIRVTPAARENP